MIFDQLQYELTSMPAFSIFESVRIRMSSGLELGILVLGPRIFGAWVCRVV